MNRAQSSLALLLGLGFIDLGCSGEAVRDVPAGAGAGETAASDEIRGGATAAGFVAPDDTASGGAFDTTGQTGPATAELWVSLTDGKVMWWRADGAGASVLEGRILGPAFGMGFDAWSNLYVTHGYAANLEAGNAIEVFDAQGTSVGQFGGSAYDCNPHSIVFDAMGRAYVGQSDCGSDVLLLDETGVLLDSFDVATDSRGAGWIALADDHCTMLYTSQGSDVKRYDVCTRMQLSNFNLAPLPMNAAQGSGANELKLTLSGGVLVANFTEIVLLDAAGSQVRVYDVEGPDGWRGLALDQDDASFWTVNHSTADVVRFDIASGEILERFNTGTAPLTVKSVVVKRSN